MVASGLARNGRAVVASLPSSTVSGDLPAPAAVASVEWIAPSNIRRDGDTQLRFALNEGGVREYQAMIAEDGGGWPFRDPVGVVRDESGRLWLYDGFHRLEAWGRHYGDSSLSSVPAVPVLAVPGDRRAAVLLAAGANIHGVARSDADKRKAVDTLLADPEWSAWSDGEIARRCGVSRPFVTKRKEILANSAAVAASITGADPGAVQYRNKHGGVSTMHTGGIADSNRSRSAAGGLASGKLGGVGGSVVASSATGSRATSGAVLARCSSCGRALTDPASAVSGMGPCCAARAARAVAVEDGKDQARLNALADFHAAAVVVLDGADLYGDLAGQAARVELRRIMIEVVRVVGVKLTAEGGA